MPSMGIEIESNDINKNAPPVVVNDEPKSQSSNEQMDSVSEQSHSNEISIPNEQEIDHSPDDDEEKQLEDELEDIDLNHKTTSPYDAIMGIIKYYVLIGFISLLFYWLAWASWMIAAERQIRRIRFTLFRNILRQEIGWFDVHNPGELSNRLIEDLDKVKNGINEQVPDFISLLSRMLGALIYALVTGWKLTLVFISIAPFVVLTFNLTVAVIVKYTIKEFQAFATASSIAQEVLQNIRTVTAFHGQAKEEERFAKNLVVAKNIGIKKGIYMGLCQCLSQTFTFTAFAVTFWYGPELVRTECHTYTAGTVIVVFVACMIATNSTAQLIPNFQSFAEALAGGSYVYEIIDRKTKIDAMNEEGDKPRNIAGDIEFDNVTFTFPARQDTSVKFSLSFRKSFITMVHPFYRFLTIYH
ncbi:unnamed protein product [Rotaria magnacalcarata]|uniref:ABC transmembrane type-1 domain-containing protein n=1 Tax=Rotaria magnacalcarata TaxID=392030 RepID=A0A8S2Q1I6_9BILA|nr:unnamed protein product [Rotaria magnacalcarata]